MQTSTITEKAYSEKSIKSDEYVTSKAVLKHGLIEFIRNVNLRSLVGVMFLFFGMIQMVTRFPQVQKVNIEDLIKVKEYLITIDDLARALEINESLTITPNFTNDTQIVQQKFQIKFHESENGQAPTISITSSMFANTETLANNRSLHFSTIKINLNNNKTNPDSISLITGFRHHVEQPVTQNNTVEQQDGIENV